jgi:Hint domain
MIRPADLLTKPGATRLLVALATLVLPLASCAAPGSTTQPTPGPSGSGAALTIPALKYVLIDAFGPLWFCDPDFFPVARADEQHLADQRLPEVKADGDAFTVIVAHLELKPGGPFNPDEKLMIYRAWKQLNAIRLSPIGQPGYQFDYINMPAAGATDGRRTAGTISDHGTISIDQQAPAGEPPCPICLARGTRIATPNGDVGVEDVRVGMKVLSVGGGGRLVTATVIGIGSTPVPPTHEVVRLALDDGRVLVASPGHPLRDGRALARIRPGDEVDGARVVDASLEPYDGGFTYDLLTDAPGGGYIAGGIPLGSTLAD